MAISQHHVLVYAFSLDPSLSLWQIKFPRDRIYQLACNGQYYVKNFAKYFFLFPTNKIDIAAEIAEKCSSYK